MRNLCFVFGSFPVVLGGLGLGGISWANIDLILLPKKKNENFHKDQNLLSWKKKLDIDYND